MIRHFTEAGHKVTVASLARSEDEAKQGEGISAHCERYLLGQINGIKAWIRMFALLPTSTPSSNGYFYSSTLKKSVDKLLEQESFDLIFVHCSSVAQYVADVQGVPKILDFGDMDSQKWLIYSKIRKFPLSIGYLIEGTKLQREEARLATKFDLCTCTTRAELDTLNSYKTGVPSDWFPNGVDSHFFSPSETPYDPDTICFIGRMDYYPNQQCMIDFCKTTLPLIREIYPDIKLLIVGAEPPDFIRRLERFPGVTVTGSVDDVRPYVTSAALTIAPLKIARGTQNKILESMAMGVPAVISEEASGGIDAEPGVHVLVARTPIEYRDAIVRLLKNTAERNALAHAARARVIENHNWKSSMKKLDQIVEKCLDITQVSEFK